MPLHPRNSSAITMLRPFFFTGLSYTFVMAKKLFVKAFIYMSASLTIITALEQLITGLQVAHGIL